ncbi:beta-ketoacyl-ACP synthase III [Veillonella magna]|uniref:beta-ketoacyl-ACP synthase III n=1 Tax=Veillonella magna TaxID=464322 RepID=UPI0026DB978E|nr:beta-ketoacyl-ACP synthase III [Veillonella magna]
MTMWTKPVGIIGTGSFLPDNVVTNHDLEKMVDTSDQWIRERTGIEERRVAPEGMNASDMATKAAKKALEAAGLTAEDIDCIIVATLTGDMAIPSTACIVQANLGATKAAAFDLGAACSGFVYGLITAGSYVNMNMFKNVLVIGVEVLSRVLNWKDRGTCILFGDGAGAAVVSTVEEGYGMRGMDMGADGTGGMSLSIPSSGTAMVPNDQRIEEGLTYIHMNGSEVYKFAVKTMGRTVLNALERANMELEELDCFIPHQANLRIIDSAAHRLKLSEDKVFVNLPKYGNTSAASIGIALDEAVRSGFVKKGDNVAFAGFGAGLTWAGLVMKWC